MKQVDELIRGELSAVKSIDAILGKIKNDTERNELTSIREDHIKAVDQLKRFAGPDFKESMGSQTAGPWGAVTSAFTGAASFFGDKNALRALQVGEQHGLNEYKEALQDKSINPEVRRVIENELLPNQEKHLQTIQRYIQ